MLTERLRRVVDQLSALPTEEQDALAALIEADLAEDRRWAAALEEPHDLVLDRLLAQAQEWVARGEDCDLDELL
ncbi:MAG TPA: hypothetical protein VJQ45_12735 [Ktedonobacterales bacterium]|nr:hypothetical protein [Ktedonobacterales bacterium]